MSSSNDQDLRNQSAQNYQERRIREDLQIKAKLAKEEENLNQNQNQNQNQNRNNSNTNLQLATELSNITFGGRTVQQKSRFGDAPSSQEKSLLPSITQQQQQQLKQQQQQKQKPTLAQEREEILQKRMRLPVYAERERLLETIKNNQVVLCHAATGSGKTTQIPQFLMEAGYKKVVCTQPRVIAATSVAERVAKEVGCALGSRVGYKVRFDSKYDPNRTDLMFVTDGMLLKECVNDPKLSEYQAIIIDEAHERSINTDLLLGLIRDLIRDRKEDLRIIVASATIAGEKFLDFFGRDIATQFHVEGVSYPVKSFFLPEPREDYVLAAAEYVWKTHLAKPIPGDILVFLPGQDDIEKCERLLKERLEATSASEVRHLIILPLFSALPAKEQQRIFEDTPENKRKVIIATNVAETSITVDGVVYVIDCGMCKQKYYDRNTGSEALALVPISKASAAQRRGRAGRTQKGECIRLYTLDTFKFGLDTDPAPEIQRSSLTSVILSLQSLGIQNPKAFDWVDLPSSEGIATAFETLRWLGCITETLEITVTGKLLSELPLEPSQAKMLVAAEREYNCGKQAAAAVAILSLQNSVFTIPREQRVAADATLARYFRETCGDITGYVQIFQAWEAERPGHRFEWCKSHFVNPISMQRVFDVRNQLVLALGQHFVSSSSTSASENAAENFVITSETDFVRLDENLTKAFVSGHFLNTALLSADMRTFTMVRSRVGGAMIHPQSCFGLVMFPPTKKDYSNTGSNPEIQRLLLQQEQQQKQQNQNSSSSSSSSMGNAKYRHCDADTGKPPLICFGELRMATSRSMTMSHVVAIPESWVLEVAPEKCFKRGSLKSIGTGNINDSNSNASNSNQLGQNIRARDFY